MDDDEIVEDGPPVLPDPAKKPLKNVYSDAEVKHYLTVHRGDITATAKEMGWRDTTLRKRIESNRDLKAAWNLLKTRTDDKRSIIGQTISNFELHTRKPMVERLKMVMDTGIVGEGGTPNGETRHGPPSEVLGDQQRTIDIEMLNEGLLEAGIKPETVEKLRSLSNINLTTGQFLVNGLDLTHRMTLFQSVSLLEEADFIKKTYLRDMQLSEQDRQGWQRNYNEICDQIGKTFDRTLIGTQAMVELMGSAGDGAGEKPSARNKGRKKFQNAGDAPKNVTGTEDDDS